jgi:hypothetical protein
MVIVRRNMLVYPRVAFPSTGEKSNMWDGQGSARFAQARAGAVRRRQPGLF